MKIAVIGSRNLDVMIEEYMPRDVDEIVSGGARGVDARAAQYAKARGIKLTEFLPQYDRFGRARAPMLNTLFTVFTHAKNTYAV